MGGLFLRTMGKAMSHRSTYGFIWSVLFLESSCVIPGFHFYLAEQPNIALGDFNPRGS